MQSTQNPPAPESGWTPRVRLFEYLGPMMHAKTTVADGRFSRVGSTNLNIASFVSNWEVDVLVDDRRSGAQMEELFEQDFANSREIGRDRTSRPAEAKPAGAGSSGRRDATRPAPAVPAALSRLGGGVVRKSIAPVHAYERAVAGAAGAVALGASLLAARFPRLVAWPMTAAGIAVGASGIRRAARPARDKERTGPPLRRARD